MKNILEGVTYNMYYLKITMKDKERKVERYNQIKGN